MGNELEAQEPEIPEEVDQHPEPEITPEQAVPSEQTESSEGNGPVQEADRTEQLEKGVVVGDRYVIEETIATQENRTIYKASEEGFLRWCSVCKDLYLLEDDDEFCDECGAELSQGWYRLTEWTSEEGPEGVDTFVQANLGHTSWLAPRDWFVWNDRRYMIQEGLEGETLASVRNGSRREDILAWGITLAEGLHILHDHGFGGLPLMPEDIMVASDNQIKIVNWGPFAAFPTETESTGEALGEARQQDLQNLASLLTVLLIDGVDDGDTEDEDEAIDPVLREILSDMAAGEYEDALTVADDLEERLHGEEPVQLSDIDRSLKTALRYDVGGRSDVGRVRPLNEDSIAMLDFTVVRDSAYETAGLYVVADGVGGHDSGEVASRIAVGTMSHFIADRLLQPDLDSIANAPDEQRYADTVEQAVHAANRAVASAEPDNEASNMGTTVTAALVVGSFAYVANVGDSRTYLYRDGKLSPVTTDHSVVARLVAIGMIEPEDVYTHPQRNYVYRALGSLEDFQVDTFFQPLFPDDRLVLCSDGLWEMVHDPEIEKVLSETESSQEACDRLVEQANENGGEDNISIVIVRGQGYEEVGD